jgi:hypothetical protein
MDIVTTSNFHATLLRGASLDLAGGRKETRRDALD